MPIALELELARRRRLIGRNIRQIGNTPLQQDQVWAPIGAHESNATYRCGSRQRWHRTRMSLGMDEPAAVVLGPAERERIRLNV